MPSKHDERIIRIMKQAFGYNRLSVALDDDLREKHAADSLDMVDILMLVEEVFNIDVPDEKWAEVRTGRDILRIVRSGRRGRGHLPIREEFRA